MQSAQLAHPWREPGAPEKPVELKPSEPSLQYGLRLGLYSILTYEGLFISEYIALSRVLPEHCALSSHELRAAILGTVGALGGLSYVHPLYKDSRPGRTAVANGLGFFGGLVAVALSPVLADRLLTRLASQSLTFDTIWTQALLSSVVVPLSTAVAWQVLHDHCLPVLLDLYDQDVIDHVNSQIQDEEMQWRLQQRAERIKTGKLPPPVDAKQRDEEELESYRAMLREKAAVKSVDEPKRMPLTQDEQEQAAIDAEIAALPEPLLPFQEVVRDAEDELALKLREVEEAEYRKMQGSETDLRAWAEKLAYGHLANTKDNTHWLNLLRKRDYERQRERDREYEAYRMRHFGLREAPAPEDLPRKSKFEDQELKDIITPFGPDAKPPPPKPEPKPRPFVRDIMAEMTSNSEKLTGDKPPRAPSVRSYGREPHMRGGLFDTNTYLSQNAKRRLAAEEARRKRIDALAKAKAEAMEDPDYEEEEEEVSDGESIPYVPARDEDDVEVASKVPGVSKPSPVQPVAFNRNINRDVMSLVVDDKANVVVDEDGTTHVLVPGRFELPSSSSEGEDEGDAESEGDDEGNGGEEDEDEEESDGEGSEDEDEDEEAEEAEEEEESESADEDDDGAESPSE